MPLTAILPQSFRPRGAEHLIRVGRDFDGGYLIDRRNLDHADFLVSMGLSDDWSFEKQFLQARAVGLVAYDPTVSPRVLARRAYDRLVHLEIPTRALRMLWMAGDFYWFFRGQGRRHEKKFVGLDAGEENISLASILAEHVPPEVGNIFFKIDIEGSEYRILDELVAAADRVEGLAIEFHDVDLHLDRIARFLERFPLNLVHVHVNNYGFVLADGIPTVIECSFSRRDVSAPGPDVSLPHPLDMPNRKAVPETEIAFHDG